MRRQKKARTICNLIEEHIHDKVNQSANRTVKSVLQNCVPASSKVIAVAFKLGLTGEVKRK
jgi:hypothetical protein